MIIALLYCFDSLILNTIISKVDLLISFSKKIIYDDNRREYLWETENLAYNDLLVILEN